MKKVIWSFVTVNIERFEELKALFESNGYELAVRTDNGDIAEIYILSEYKCRSSDESVIQNDRA